MLLRQPAAARVERRLARLRAERLIVVDAEEIDRMVLDDIKFLRRRLPEHTVLREHLDEILSERAVHGRVEE